MNVFFFCSRSSSYYCYCYYYYYYSSSSSSFSLLPISVEASKKRCKISSSWVHKKEKVLNVQKVPHMVNISFLIYKTEFFGPFHMLQKKKSKEISRQIRFFPQKSACLPNSRSFAKRPSRQIWRRHGHRNDGKMVNRPHRWNSMRIVVSLLQYWLCTAVGF